MLKRFVKDPSAYKPQSFKLKEVSAQNQERPLVTIAQQCLLCPSNLTDHGVNFDEIFSLQCTLMDKFEISIDGCTWDELPQILQF